MAYAYTDYLSRHSFCEECTPAGVIDTGGAPLYRMVKTPVALVPPMLATFQSGRSAMSSIQSDSGCPPGASQCVKNPRARGFGQPINGPENRRYGAQNPPQMEGCGCSACLAGDYCARAEPIEWIDEYGDCNCMSCGVPLENPIKGVHLSDPAYFEKYRQLGYITLGVHQYPVEYLPAYVKEGEEWDPDFENLKWQVWDRSPSAATGSNWYDVSATKAASHEAQLASGERDHARFDSADNPMPETRQIPGEPGAYVGNGLFYRTWPKVYLLASSNFPLAVKAFAAGEGLDVNIEWAAWFVPVFNTLSLQLEGSAALIPLEVNAGPCGMCPVGQAPPGLDPEPPAELPGVVNLVGDDWGQDPGIKVYDRSMVVITTGGNGEPTKVQTKDWNGDITTILYGVGGQILEELFNGVPVPVGTDAAKQKAEICAVDPSLEICQPPVTESAIPWKTIGIVGGLGLAAYLFTQRRR